MIKNNKTYKSLKFGTSGLRDFDSNLTDMEVYINTRGFLEYLIGLKSDNGGILRGETISVASDFRPSSNIDRIPRAVAAAVIDSGCLVDWCGQIPTPAVTYYGMQKNRASIMVTGSHIPYGMNGIKFNKTSGEILKEEEVSILENVEKVRAKVLCSNEMFDDNGKFKNLSQDLLKKADDSLSIINNEAERFYVERYAGVFGKEALNGLEVIFYQQTTVGRDILPEILESIGAKVCCRGRLDEEKEFLSVDTEKMKPEIKDKLRELSTAFKKEKRQKPFAVISADGDSDRPVLCDEEGEFMPGDKLGVITAMYLKPTFVALPITCNSSAVEMLKELGVVVQTRVGSPYINKAMIDAIAENPQIKASGYEANGGYLTGSAWIINDKVLTALPTRDAALPIICALCYASENGLKISELFDIFTRHTNADVIDNNTPGCENYTAQMGKEIINIFSLQDVIEVDFRGNEKIDDKLVKIKQKLSSYFTKENGFSDIIKLNFLDGIRIYFENGDIVHFRPSGNAPEFRIYAESLTQSRADEIINLRAEIISKIIRKFCIF